MQIKDAMTPTVDLADPNMKAHDAARSMRQDDVGALPVGENDRLVGMVTDRDIAMRAVAGDKPAEDTPIRDVMSGGVFYCFEDDSLQRAGEVMAEHQVHRLPVLNRDKRLVGIVAMADLARNGNEGQQAAMVALQGVSQATGVPRQ